MQRTFPANWLVSIALVPILGMVAPIAAYSQDFPSLPDIDTSTSDNGVVPLPRTVDEAYHVFSRYTKVVAPNGKPIHIVGEDGYSDEQMVYARKVLANHLTSVAGSKYGNDKTHIANSMANSEAVLTLYASTESMRSPAARKFREARIPSQDLRAYETIIEGTAEYMSDDPRRDASYEEILHFVQDYGILRADPELDGKLWEAYRGALVSDIYTHEDAETNEYFICALEAYFGLWRHDPTGNGTREGEYVPISRQRLLEVDPAMYDIIEGFFGKFWLYTAEITAEFDGTFSLTFDADLTYTNKSQYLTKATLTGSNDSSLIGNNEDNVLAGNDGDNEITPGGGDDVVNGGEGVDTAVFPGESRDYVVIKASGQIVVDGFNYSRDGRNTLVNIERLRFSDAEIEVGDL